MAKRKKRGGKPASSESKLNLATAIINLIVALLILLDKITG